MGTARRMFEQMPQACAMCNVRMDSKDEQLHMKQHHVQGSVQIAEILWITPHEAVYKGKHYKVKKQICA